MAWVGIYLGIYSLDKLEQLKSTKQNKMLVGFPSSTIDFMRKLCYHK